jgi:hypothetical protein
MYRKICANRRRCSASNSGTSVAMVVGSVCFAFNDSCGLQRRFNHHPRPDSNATSLLVRSIGRRPSILSIVSIDRPSSLSLSFGTRRTEAKADPSEQRSLFGVAVPFETRIVHRGDSSGGDVLACLHKGRIGLCLSTADHGFVVKVAYMIGIITWVNRAVDGEEKGAVTGLVRCGSPQIE